MQCVAARNIDRHLEIQSAPSLPNCVTNLSSEDSNRWPLWNKEFVPRRQIAGPKNPSRPSVSQCYIAPPPLTRLVFKDDGFLSLCREMRRKLLRITCFLSSTRKEVGKAVISSSQSAFIVTSTVGSFVLSFISNLQSSHRMCLQA